MKKIVFALSLILCTAASSQTWQDWTNLGNEALEDNDPYGALRYFQEAMKLDSSRGSTFYHLGEAYREVQNYPKAAYYYDKIFRRDRGMIYPDVIVKLAEMQMQSGDYEKAKQNWRRVRDEYRDEPYSYEYLKATQSLRSCDLAKKWMTEPLIQNLDEAPSLVNSGDSEFGGIWHDDGSLSFTSLRGEYDQKGRLLDESYFIKPYRTDTSLTKLFQQTLGVEIGQNYGNYVTSTKGQKAVVVIDATGRKAIHFYDGLVWKKILPSSEADTANYTHPSFGKIGLIDVLFFASDRKDGFGQYDIWYAECTKPSEPFNLGDKINTPGNEVTPFYRREEEVLYFSSDWHHGFGGYDIFKSIFFEGDFDYPENLKAPFSSPSNDLYFSFNEKIKRGSITSNRVGPDSYGGCCNNLYVFEEVEEEIEETLPKIETLEDLNAYLPVTLYFHNDEPDPRTRNTKTIKNYLDTYRSYLDLLPAYREEYSAGLKEQEARQAEQDMDEFFVEEIDQGVSDLDFFSELLLRELSEGAQIELTARGFASPLADTDYNVNLTQRRISSLENYLEDYERGALRPYLNASAENGGLLRISRIPFGEYIAEKVVSDNPNESNAIYSIAAAKERKIELFSVTRATDDSTQSSIQFDTEIVDLGRVKNGDTLSFEFPLTVMSETAFSIDSISKSDEVELNFEPEMDRGRHLISGFILIENQNGKQSRVIELFGNMVGNRKELNLTFEVE
jgi:hypothetical protein